MFAQRVQRSPVLLVSRSWKPLFRSFLRLSQKSRNHVASSCSSLLFIPFSIGPKESRSAPWLRAVSTIKPRVRGDVSFAPGLLMSLSEKLRAKFQYSLM
ncbi:hypothetical protein ATCV1_z208L [Acanthocystis turfacea chlorella virus 1]|uniref:Uncharacterized protein z208L n=1 Tax=Chlorovirus heliozoae TaxID=322019 RepID=A7K8G8_9PHYC|nr:hypothetical protein ATCV1_z208L [Acanthocystis turfacea chlorella virus 1]ABT16342.1 hypothetical protein ATCV1_z208L [Acanthocystis turfacea chlorella virus 1]